MAIDRLTVGGVVSEVNVITQLIKQPPTSQIPAISKLIANYFVTLMRFGCGHAACLWCVWARLFGARQPFAFALVLVHGLVGVFKQGFEFEAVFGGDCGADAGAQEQLP